MSETNPKGISEESPELLTVKETAEYLRIPVPTVYYLINQKKLPGVQIGGRWRIKRKLIDSEILGRSEEEVKHTALIVEDNNHLQQLLMKTLEAQGFDCTIASNGSEAISTVDAIAFDIVFLGLHLPDMGGDEVFGQMKKKNEELPIVIMTSYPDSERLSRILQHGPTMVVKKPIDLSYVNQIIDNVRMMHSTTSADEIVSAE